MWQPEENSLRALVDLLNQSQLHDDLKQKEVHQKIKELSSQPEFSCYLVYILSIRDNEYLTLRKIAGATLKGVLERVGEKIPQENLDYVKLKLMETFDDKSASIRSSVANAMTALFVKIGFNKWPELLGFFSNNLEQHDVDWVTSSLECIAKILEDLDMQSENYNYFEEKNDSPLTKLIPKLITMCDSQYNTTVRTLAFHSLNLFTSMMPPSFLANMNNYFQAVFNYAEDANSVIRQECCEGFIKILEKRKDLVTENLQPILEKILKLTVDQNTEVKKRACLFWNEYLLVEEDETSQRMDALKQYLEFLVPSIIDCLPYTEEDLLTLDSKEAGEHHNFYDDEEEDGIIKISDDQNKDIGQGTLRKEAGFVLQGLAMEFEGIVFEKAQLKLEECLKSDNWLLREVGILALGSIARGAEEAIKDHFDALFPFLMESLDNNHPLVKSIACWTLSRFTEWIVKAGGVQEEIIRNYLISVLKLMGDENSRVQEAACSALSKLSNEGPKFVENYISDILQMVKIASEKYCEKEAIQYLYDAIGSIAFNISKAVTQNQNVENLFIEILLKKWKESKFETKEAVCLVECTDTVIKALEKNSGRYAQFFITNLLLLIYNYLELKNVHEKNEPYFQREVAIRCFDLLDSFLKYLGTEIQQFIIASDYQKLFHECVNDEDIVLRQVTLSSADHIARFCPSILRENLQPVSEVLLKNLFYTPKEIDSDGIYMGCCNNAASAAGNFALAYPEFIACIPTFTEKICEIFQGRIHKGVALTLATTLGKFGLIDPETTSQFLGRLLKPFCMSIGSIDNNPEKEQALRGLFAMILKNPKGALESFDFLVIALVNFNNLSQDLMENAKGILHEFKAFAGNSWSNYFNKFPNHIQQTLSEKFGI